MVDKLDFSKYHGTGNDFVLLDNRQGKADFLTPQLRAQICHRRFGIGADGIIYLEDSSKGLYMRYFNSDGHMGSLCGNGSRCFVRFCLELGIWRNEGFYAADGHHHACILTEDRIAVAFQDVSFPEEQGRDWFLNTGSPHVVRIVEQLAEVNVFAEGTLVRHAQRYSPGGTNVNFIEEKQGRLLIRTFERGVEDETLSCGTGAVASALVWAYRKHAHGKHVQYLETKGGNLEVDFTLDGHGFNNIWLIGPAVHVMDGTWLIKG